MIAPDHDCAWTRGRRSAIRRTGGSLGGAGLPRAVLEAVARRLGVELSSTADPEDEHTQLITVGPWRGSLHDGCFVHLDADDAEVRGALLAATLELHESYLRGRLGPDALAAADNRLAEGGELLLHSVPNRGELQLSSYAASAGWWQRRTAPVTRIRIRTAH